MHQDSPEFLSGMQVDQGRGTWTRICKDSADSIQETTSHAILLQARHDQQIEQEDGGANHKNTSDIALVAAPQAPQALCESHQLSNGSYIINQL